MFLLQLKEEKKWRVLLCIEGDVKEALISLALFWHLASSGLAASQPLKRLNVAVVVSPLFHERDLVKERR